MLLGRILIILCLVLYPCNLVKAEEQKKAIIVVVDEITIGELQEANLPNITGLIKQGGLGLMNTNTGGSRIREHTHVTIGAGKIAQGSIDAGLAFNASDTFQHETAGEVFRRRTGKVVGPDAGVHLGIAGILRANADRKVYGSPGMLGDTLRTAGIITGVIGNADANEKYLRHALTIAMDHTGIVDRAVLNEMVKVDGKNLLLHRTDFEKLIQSLKEILVNADLIVVETGDITRIEQLRTYALDPLIQRSKTDALKEIDRFIGEIQTITKEYNTLLMVVTPTPSKDAAKNKNIVTPLIVWKAGVTPGFLSSGTTRRTGIVANTDIAPTILEHFGLAVPSAMSGRPIKIVPGDNALEKLVSDNKHLVFVYRYRPSLVKGYVFMQIVVVVASVLSLIAPGNRARFFQLVLLMLASVPLSFLLVSIFTPLPIVIYLLYAVGIAVFLVSLSYLSKRYHHLMPFAVITFLTAGAIILDLIQSAPLMKSSVLGYDAMAGARYYGLGNEYMGVLIGSVIIAQTVFLEASQKKRPVYIGFFALCIAILLLIAAPNLGSNAGGFIAAAAAFVYLFYRLWDKSVTKFRMVVGLFVVMVVFFSVVLYDVGRSPEMQSHFGRSANLILTNGIGEAYNIIVRKVALNIKLIKYTIWSQVFLITYIATAFLFYRPVGVMKIVREKYPYLTRGFWGVVVGSIFALVFNDSGIVAAATMSIFAAAPLIYTVMYEKEEGEKTKI